MPASEHAINRAHAQPQTRSYNNAVTEQQRREQAEQRNEAAYREGYDETNTQEMVDEDTSDEIPTDHERYNLPCNHWEVDFESDSTSIRHGIDPMVYDDEVDGPDLHSRSQERHHVLYQSAKAHKRSRSQRSSRSNQRRRRRNRRSRESRRRHRSPHGAYRYDIEKLLHEGERMMHYLRELRGDENPSDLEADIRELHLRQRELIKRCKDGANARRKPKIVASPPHSRAVHDHRRSFDDKRHVSQGQLVDAIERIMSRTAITKDLPYFTGLKGLREYANWRRQIEFQLSDANMSEKEKIKTILRLLRDKASDWHNEQLTLDQNFDYQLQSSQQLFHLLELRFADQSQVMMIHLDWKHLQQVGDLVSYREELTKLHSLAPKETHDELMLAIGGLAPKYHSAAVDWLKQDSNLHRGWKHLISDLIKGEKISALVEQTFKGRETAEHATSKATATRPLLKYSRAVHANARNFQTNGRPQVHTRGQDARAKLSNVQQQGASAKFSKVVVPTELITTVTAAMKDDPTRYPKQWAGYKQCCIDLEVCWLCWRTGHKVYDCPHKKDGKCVKCGGDHQTMDCIQVRMRKNALQRAILNTKGYVQVSSNATKINELSGNLLIYLFDVAGVEASVLIDSGSECSFISHRFVVKHKLKREVLAHSIVVQCADASMKQTVTHAVRRLKIRHDAFIDYVDVPVFAGLVCDLLLGSDWLRLWNPEVDWERRTMKLKHGGSSITLEPTVKRSLEDALVSPSTVRRCIRRNTTRNGSGEGYNSCFVGLVRLAVAENTVIAATVTNNTETTELNELQEAIRKQCMRPELCPVLEKYLSVFTQPEGLPTFDKIKHIINLQPGAEPVIKRTYPMNPRQREELTKQLTKLLQEGWIRPSFSPWGAPVLFVTKKDGSFRLCVDYRGLNALTAKDAFPLPRIQELIDKVANHAYYTKMDLASGFHQILIDEKSIEKTAFRTPTPIEGSSHFEWTVMPFGLINAPPTFQRVMERVLAGYDQYCVVYIDDILVFSDTLESHIQHVNNVLTRLKEHNLKVKIAKSTFAAAFVEYLGHMISQHGLSPLYDKVEAIRNWKTPLTKRREVKQFLGLASYYRRYISNFATIAAPLTTLTSTSAPFKWSDAEETAMTKLKNALTTAPTLSPWVDGLPTKVTTDASTIGVAAVLQQLQPGKNGEHTAIDVIDTVELEGWHPIAYWSRKTGVSEKNYSATDLEWLAVVEAVTRVWAHYLAGGPCFIIETDHSALKQLLTVPASQLTQRRARWVERLSEFAYKVVHRKGDKNKVADALSRNPTDYVATHAIAAVANSIIHATKGVLDDADIKKWKRAQRCDAQYEMLKRLADDELNRDYTTEDGYVYDKNGACYVPNDYSIRTKLLAMYHDAPYAGHFGNYKTYMGIRKDYFWIQLKKDTYEYVKSCVTCQRTKRPAKPVVGKYYPVVAEFPWQVVSLDFVGGMPATDSEGYTECFVVVDKFTKMVHLAPCKHNPTSKQTVDMFLNIVFRAHGMPEIIISDRGTQFNCAFWRELFRSLGTKTVLASVHHPQGNGLVERMNQVIIKELRILSQTQPKEWVNMLPMVEFAINNSYCTTTGHTPFELNSFNTIRTPANFNKDKELMHANMPKDIGDKQAIVQQTIARVQGRLLELAEKVQTKMNKRKKTAFEVGDWVWVAQDVCPTQLDTTRKLKHLYSGPYQVVAIEGKNAYRMAGMPTDAPTVQNIEHLKPFYRSDTRFKTRPEELPQPVFTPQGIEWPVEKIVGCQKRGNQTRYKVKWKDCPDTSWEPETALSNAKELIAEYHAQTPLHVPEYNRPTKCRRRRV